MDPLPRFPGPAGSSMILTPWLWVVLGGFLFSTTTHTPGNLALTHLPPQQACCPPRRSSASPGAAVEVSHSCVKRCIVLTFRSQHWRGQALQGLPAWGQSTGVTGIPRLLENLGPRWLDRLPHVAQTCRLCSVCSLRE